MGNIASLKAWQAENGTSKKRYRDKLRKDVLDGYGGKCMCCGSEYRPHLTIDHVKGGGRQARAKQVTPGRETYVMLRRLLREGIVDPDYQILCYNCNSAKHVLGRCGCQDGEG